VSNVPQYYFNIARGRRFDDVDGLELEDVAAARAEAAAFANDLMRMGPERRDWSKWVVCVTDSEDKPVFDLPFSAVA